MLNADVGRRPVVDRAVFTALGAAVVAVTQMSAGWWLDSGARVAAVALSLVVLAGIGAHRGTFAAARAIGIALGALAASAAILLVRGPGTIWPIVLGLALVIVAAAVSAGAGVGLLLRRSR